MKKKITYKRFLAERMAKWADLGMTDPNWDRFLWKILPIMISELRGEIPEKVETHKQKL